jgi:hypothetical protein
MYIYFCSQLIERRPVRAIIPQTPLRQRFKLVAVCRLIRRGSNKETSIHLSVGVWLVIGKAAPFILFFVFFFFFVFFVFFVFGGRIAV